MDEDGETKRVSIEGGGEIYLHWVKHDIEIVWNTFITNGELATVRGDIKMKKQYG